MELQIGCWKHRFNTETWTKEDFQSIDKSGSFVADFKILLKNLEIQIKSNDIAAGFLKIVKSWFRNSNHDFPGTCIDTKLNIHVFSFSSYQHFIYGLGVDEKKCCHIERDFPNQILLKWRCYCWISSAELASTKMIENEISLHQLLVSMSPHSTDIAQL